MIADANAATPFADVLARANEARASAVRECVAGMLAARRMKGEMLSMILRDKRCPACGARCVYDRSGFVCAADPTHPPVAARTAPPESPDQIARRAREEMILLELRYHTEQAAALGPEDEPEDGARRTIILRGRRQPAPDTQTGDRRTRKPLGRPRGSLLIGMAPSALTPAHLAALVERIMGR